MAVSARFCDTTPERWTGARSSPDQTEHTRSRPIRLGSTTHRPSLIGTSDSRSPLFSARGFENVCYTGQGGVSAVMSASRPSHSRSVSPRCNALSRSQSSRNPYHLSTVLFYQSHIDHFMVPGGPEKARQAGPALKRYSSFEREK